MSVIEITFILCGFKYYVYSGVGNLDGRDRYIKKIALKFINNQVDPFSG